MSSKAATQRDRTEAHKPFDDKCIEWWGYVTAAGYGQVGRNTPAHRHVWEECFGLIPQGLYVLHKCDNHPCVNPNHLYLGSSLDNVLDRAERGFQGAPEMWRARTHCSAGHEYTPENIRPDIRYGKLEGRRCKACSKIWKVRTKERRNN